MLARSSAAASQLPHELPPRGYQPARREADGQANQFGPPTTSRMDGAGGPHNEWDCKIRAAERRGNPQLALRLREARARINLAFGHVESVWVPTASQRAMLGLQAEAAANGIATVRP